MVQLAEQREPLNSTKLGLSQSEKSFVALGSFRGFRFRSKKCQILTSVCGSCASTSPKMVQLELGSLLVECCTSRHPTPFSFVICLFCLTHARADWSVRRTRPHAPEARPLGVASRASRLSPHLDACVHGQVKGTQGVLPKMNELYLHTHEQTNFMQARHDGTATQEPDRSAERAKDLVGTSAGRPRTLYPVPQR